MADRKARKEQTTARRQEQILKSAREVFSRKGFAAATISEIARQAGLAAGTLYLYYPNKRELFIAVIEGLMVKPLLQIFEKEPSQKFPLTLQDALNDRLKFLTSDFFTHLLFLVGEILRDPELKTLFLERLIHPLLSRMEVMYRLKIDAGEFRSLDPSVVVRLVGGMMVGLTLLKNLEGDAGPFTRLPQEKLVVEIMHFILYGLSANRIVENP